jgi:riboflavin transporter FmnP
MKIGLLGGLSSLLMILIHFPIFPGAPFLMYDPSDIPVLLGTFALGPAEGILILFIKNALYLMARPTPQELIGVPMNMIAVGFMVLTAGFLYRRRRTQAGAVIALISGTLAMTAVMIPANIIVYPIFAKLFAPGAEIGGLVVLCMTCIVPFNIMKGIINSAAIFLIYKKVSHLFKADDSRCMEIENSL